MITSPNSTTEQASCQPDAGLVPIANTETAPTIPHDQEVERRSALAASFAPPPVKERIQISQMCRLIIYSDGSAALWSGVDRVALSAYEATRLGHALASGVFPVERQEVEDAI